MFDLGHIRTRAKLDFYQSGGNINEKKKNDTKTMAKNRFNVIRPKNVIPGTTRNDNETTFDFVKCLINDTRTTFCILLSFRSFWMSFRHSDVIPKRPLRTQTTAERPKATGKKWSRLPLSNPTRSWRSRRRGAAGGGTGGPSPAHTTLSMECLV